MGLRVDTDRSLHLYINKQHQGMAAAFVPDPCFAFFDLFGPYRKVCNFRFAFTENEQLKIKALTIIMMMAVMILCYHSMFKGFSL